MQGRFGAGAAHDLARRCCAVSLSLVLAACVQASVPNSDTVGEQSELRLIGDLSPVHDPAVIREGSTYHLFSTGQVADETGLIPWRTSTNLSTWEYRGAVFAKIPDWAAEQVPGTKGLWAPDVIHSGREFRLYYSVSTFGKNRSAIGLATTPTLDPQAPGYGWTDRGLVFASGEADEFNAIDPNIFIDRDGRHWMTFGSFWSGIKMVELDPDSGKPASDRPVLHSLARRPSPGAVEAPFLIRRGDFYYLFVSFDFCCRGERSTYRTMVGRSRDLLGPYVDRQGRPMLEGGGSQILPVEGRPEPRWRGPGHVAILREGDQHYIVHHAYDAQRDGAPTLRIRALRWSADGWPTAGGAS